MDWLVEATKAGAEYALFGYVARPRMDETSEPRPVMTHRTRFRLFWCVNVYSTELSKEIERDVKAGLDPRRDDMGIAPYLPTWAPEMSIEWWVAFVEAGWDLGARLANGTDMLPRSPAEAGWDLGARPAKGTDMLPRSPAEAAWLRMATYDWLGVFEDEVNEGRAGHGDHMLALCFDHLPAQHGDDLIFTKPELLNDPWVGEAWDMTLADVAAFAEHHGPGIEPYLPQNWLQPWPEGYRQPGP